MAEEHDLVHQEQVIVEIVSRLPFDSVLQCRCVCKAWNSLLHEPYFTQLHTNRCSTSSSPLNLFSLVDITNARSIVRLEDYYYDDNDEQQQQQQLKVISKPPLNDAVVLNHEFKNIWWVMGSCNGLICLLYHKKNYIILIIIYNPITREYVELPDGGGNQMGMYGDVGVSVFGFGYHPSTNEYKLVRIIHLSSNKSYIRCVKIYTLGSGGGSKWRIKENEKVDYKLKFKGVLANGALHWLTVKGAKIVSFDLEDEKFRVISPSPPPLSLLPLGTLTEKAGFDVGVLGKSLCITVQKGYVTDIWVMNYTITNNIKWSKEFSISAITIPPAKGYRRTYCELVGFTKRGRILCLYNRKHLLFYDPITNSYDQHLCSVGSDIPHSVVMDCVPRVVPYRKSFVSLKALGEDAKVVEREEEEDAKIVEPVEIQQHQVQQYGFQTILCPQQFAGTRVPHIIYSCSLTNNGKLSGSIDSSSTGKTKIVKLCISFLLSLFSFDI